MTVRNSYTQKIREDILGQVTPNVFQSAEWQQVQGAYRPAPWLPIAFTKYDRDHGTEYFVISSGKVVALTADGYVVPAGYYERFAKATGTTVLTYTATDYAEKVIDLTTGLPYAVNGTTSYTALVVAKALVERGLVREDVVSNSPPSSNDDVEDIVQAYISLPVGVAAYDYWKWAGVAEENNQAWLNMSKQHAVAFYRGYQMRIPLRASLEVTDDDFITATVDGSAVVTAQAAGDFPQPGEAWKVVALAGLTRYDLDGDEPIVALALASKPVAKNTDRTPVSCDTDDVLIRERSSIALISQAGDWFLDGEVGLLFVHEDTWDTLVGDTATVVFSYTAYDDASTGAASERYMYFDGEVRPGARLSIDEMSNFVTKGSTGDIFAGAIDLGQVLHLVREPGPFMAQTKSQWAISGVTKVSKMPGTATAGYSHHITLPDEPIADTLVHLVFEVK